MPRQEGPREVIQLCQVDVHGVKVVEAARGPGVRVREL